MFGKLWDLEENIEKEKIRLYEEIAVDEETDGEAVMQISRGKRLKIYQVLQKLLICLEKKVASKEITHGSHADSSQALVRKRVLNKSIEKRFRKKMNRHFFEYYYLTIRLEKIFVISINKLDKKVTRNSNLSAPSVQFTNSNQTRVIVKKALLALCVVYIQLGAFRSKDIINGGPAFVQMMYNQYDEAQAL